MNTQSTTLILPPPRSYEVYQQNHPTYDVKDTNKMVFLEQQRSGLHSARDREARGKNRRDRLDKIDAKIGANRQAILDHRDKVEPHGWRKSKFQPI